MPPPDIKRSWMMRFAWTALFVCLMLMGPLAAADDNKNPIRPFDDKTKVLDLSGHMILKDKTFSFSVEELDVLIKKAQCFVDNKPITFDISYSGDDTDEENPNQPGEGDMCSHKMKIGNDPPQLFIYTKIKDDKDAKAKGGSFGKAKSVSVTITKDGKANLKDDKDEPLGDAKDLTVCKPKFKTDEGSMKLQVTKPEGEEVKKGCAVQFQAGPEFSVPPTTPPPPTTTEPLTTIPTVPAIASDPSSTDLSSAATNDPVPVVTISKPSDEPLSGKPSDEPLSGTTPGDGKTTHDDNASSEPGGEAPSTKWLWSGITGVVVGVLCCIVIIALLLVYFLLLAPNNNADNGDDDSRRDDNRRRRKSSQEDSQEDEGEDGKKKKHHHKKPKSPEPDSMVDSYQQPPSDEIKKLLGEFYLNAGAYDMGTQVTSDDPAIQAANEKRQQFEIARNTYDKDVLKGYTNANDKSNEKTYDPDPTLNFLQRQYLLAMMKRNAETVERIRAEQKERRRILAAHAKH